MTLLERARKIFGIGQAGQQDEEKKTAIIYLRRGRGHQQEIGFKNINKLLREIELSTVREDAMAYAGIAVGYANAMQHFGLMSEEELINVIKVIEQVLEAACHSSFFRFIRISRDGNRKRCDTRR